jgi:hypothetical protein
MMFSAFNVKNPEFGVKSQVPLPGNILRAKPDEPQRVVKSQSD